MLRFFPTDRICKNGVFVILSILMNDASNANENRSKEPLWSPTPEQIGNSEISRFAQRFSPSADPSTLEGYRALHAWSLRDRGVFWSALWRYCDVIGEPGSIPWIASGEMLNDRWFPEGRLNYTQNLLRDIEDASRARDEVVLVACDERGRRAAFQRSDLKQQVIAVARFLKAHGVVAGDRVAAVLPNGPCAIVGYLASAAIGAIWSSCSPDFGPDAIRDRFAQIQPRVLISSTETVYNGKTIRPVDRATEVLPQLTSVEHLLVEGGVDGVPQSIVAKCSVHAWEEVLACSNTDPWTWEKFPFDHPLCIVYSSGTTGVPKCIVHRTGGVLLQHLKEHRLHCDLRPGDAMLYYTTTGWMMWNWLVGALAAGARIVAYDGSPVAPDNGSLWKIAERESLTHFGASARYYAMLDKAGYEPGVAVSLASLRCVMSTGSPLLPETFDWIYRSVKRDVHLASISGGTDILSCFVLGNPCGPVVRGEIQCAGLGMDVRILDESGQSIENRAGELACCQAFPSMPLGFWNDPDQKKYRASYFERSPGVWCHGDWAQRTEHGGFIIYGRSDATLNPGGVRIGTAEIYQQVESFPDIAESLATCLKQDGDEKIVLFVRMVPGKHLTDGLQSELRTALRQRCSPRHVPAIIHEAPDLPRTISGKLSEIAVRNAICGMELGNAGALANPESLAFFRAWRATSAETR
jgi:acetoacetyl-CoA synthetase